MVENNGQTLKDDSDFLKETSNAYLDALNSDGNFTEEQKEKIKRLEFSVKTKRVLAQRVGYRCSCPDCTNITIGPGDDPYSVVVLGEAAHIIGAIQKNDGFSPRSNSTLSEEEIRSIDNGIWLCRHHHKLVDSKTSKYTATELKSWKSQAEKKQEQLMEIKEPAFVEDYVYPNIRPHKGISTSDFRNSEWCLLAYLIEYYDDHIFYRDFEYDDEGRNFFSKYQDWLSLNSIDPKITNIRFNSLGYEMANDVREIVNKLTGLVVMKNYCLDYGKEFDNFCEALFEDEKALEKIKNKLSKV